MEGINIKEKQGLELSLEEKERADFLQKDLIKDGEKILETTEEQIKKMDPEKKKAFVSKLLTLAGVLGVLVGGALVYDNYTEAQINFERDLPQMKYSIGMALTVVSGIFLLAKHEFRKYGSNSAMS